MNSQAAVMTRALIYDFRAGITVSGVQVHLAKPALEVTAPSTANDREAEDGAPSISRSGDEHDSDSRSYNNEANASGATFSDDAPSSAPTVESTDDMASVSSGMSNNSHSNNSSLSTSIPATATDGKSFVGADHADAASQDTNALEGGRGAISDEDTDDTIASSFDWVDDCDSTVCTLVVQKGQQQQELLVSGGITRQQLVHEVDNIVSMLSTA